MNPTPSTKLVRRLKNADGPIQLSQEDAQTLSALLDLVGQQRDGAQDITLWKEHAELFHVLDPMRAHVERLAAQQNKKNRESQRLNNEPEHDYDFIGAFDNPNAADDYELQCALSFTETAARSLKLQTPTGVYEQDYNKPFFADERPALNVSADLMRDGSIDVRCYAKHRAFAELNLNAEYAREIALAILSTVLFEAKGSPAFREISDRLLMYIGSGIRAEYERKRLYERRDEDEEDEERDEDGSMA